MKSQHPECGAERVAYSGPAAARERVCFTDAIGHAGRIRRRSKFRESRFELRIDDQKFVDSAGRILAFAIVVVR